MKPLKIKVLCSLSCFMFLSLISVSPVSAYSKEVKTPNYESVKLVQTNADTFSTTYNGEQYFFSSEEDMNYFITDHKARAYNYSDKIVSSSTVNNGYIGAISPYDAWYAASGYTLSSAVSYTASGSISYDGYGVGLSYTKSAGLGIQVPANSNYLNKLGAWRTYTLNKWLTTVTDEMGHFVRSYYSVTVSYSGSATINTCYSAIKPYCDIPYMQDKK